MGTRRLDHTSPLNLMDGLSRLSADKLDMRYIYIYTHTHAHTHTHIYIHTRAGFVVHNMRYGLYLLITNNVGFEMMKMN